MDSFKALHNEKEKINQIKAINIFKNLKSNYLLQYIFDVMVKNKSLQIIKYNKKMQKRFNLSINDFKEYSEIYSPIEIEIIPLKNKYGEFINIKKGEESF